MQKSIYVVSYIANINEFHSMLGLIEKAKQLCELIEGNVNTIIFTEGKDDFEDAIYSGADELQIITIDRLLETAQVDYLYELFRNNRPYAVLSINSHWAKSMFPRLAAKLGAGLTASCIQIEIGEDGLLHQIRPAKENSTMATIISPYTLPQMATIQDGIYQLTNKDCTRKGKIIKKEFSFLELGSQRCIKKSEKKINRQAKIVIAVGRGINNRQNVELVEKLAKLLNAEIVVTRPLVENGWFDKSYLVGISGKTVSPNIYLTIGISGAIQHLIGVNKADIIAINIDKEAAIFDYATCGVVGDSGVVLKNLIEKLQEDTVSYV